MPAFISVRLAFALGWRHCVGHVGHCNNNDDDNDDDNDNGADNRQLPPKRPIACINTVTFFAVAKSHLKLLQTAV